MSIRMHNGSKWQKLAVVVTLLLCLVLSGCVRAEKVEGAVDVPPFTIIIDGETYTDETFKDLQVYECKSTSTGYLQGPAGL